MRCASLVFLSVLSLAAVALADEPLPTLEQAKALYGEGKYKDALGAITALQDLRGKKAENVDRFALFMLKGETLLRLKEGTSAISAFELARKEATTPEQRDQAAAVETLVKHCSGFVYRPKVTGPEKPEPIDILDEAGRKKAFEAFLHDELPPLQERLKTAGKATSLPPITDLARPALALRPVEVAATGKDDGCKAVLAALTDRAATLVDETQAAQDKQIETITTAANKLQEGYIQQPDPTNPRRTINVPVLRRTGLTAAQVASLRQIIATCEKAPQAMADLTAALAAEPDKFKSQAQKAAATATAAKALLATDFTKPVPATGTTTKPGRGGRGKTGATGGG